MRTCTPGATQNSEPIYAKATRWKRSLTITAATVSPCQAAASPTGTWETATTPVHNKHHTSAPVALPHLLLHHLSSPARSLWFSQVLSILYTSLPAPSLHITPSVNSPILSPCDLPLPLFLNLTLSRVVLHLSVPPGKHMLLFPSDSGVFGRGGIV